MARARHRYAILAVMAAFGSARCAPHASPNCSDQVHYLSDTDAAYAYLEARQRQIYEANPNLTDPFCRAELNKPGGVATFSELSERLSKQG